MKGLKPRTTQWEGTEFRLRVLLELERVLLLRYFFMQLRRGIDARLTLTEAVETIVIHPRVSTYATAAFYNLKRRAAAVRAARKVRAVAVRREYLLDQHVVAVTWKLWKTRAERRQSRRQMAAEASDRRRLARGAIREWKTKIDLIKEIESRAVTVYHGSLLRRRVFEHWAEEVVVRRFIVHRNVRAAGRVLDTFIAEYNWRVDARARAEDAKLALARRKAGLVLAGWWGVAVRSRPDRQRAAIIQERWRQLTLGDTLTTWRRATGERRLVKRVLRQAGRCWRWRLAEYPLEVEEADVKGDVLHAWAGLAQQSRAHQHRVSTERAADVFRRSVLMTRALAGLQVGAEASIKDRARLAAAWRGWGRVRAGYDRRGAAVIQTRQRRVLKACWTVLVDEVDARAVDRCHTQWAALWTWRRAVHHGRHVVPAMHLHQRQLVTAISAWKLAVFKRRLDLQNGARLAAHRARVMQYRALSRWVGRWSALQSARVSVEQRVGTRCLQSAFDQWTVARVRSEGARVKTARATGHREYTALAQTFGAWRSVWQDVRDGARLEEVADTFLGRALVHTVGLQRAAPRGGGLRLTLLTSGERIATAVRGDDGVYQLPTGVVLDGWAMMVYDNKVSLSAWVRWRMFVRQRVDRRRRRQAELHRRSAISVATPTASLLAYT